MPTPEPVEFALQGEINGTPISPAHVPFGVMRKFHEDVEKLVLGSNQGSLNDTVVEVRDGSYALVVPIPENVREGFERDMAVAVTADVTANPDPARLNVLLGWQKRAAFEKNVTYFVRPQAARARFGALRIDAETALRRPQADRWIAVELMLLGELREAGGEKANLHVRLRDQPQPVIVAVDWDLLKREPAPFAGEKLLRVSAERNERTKILRKLRLIEFVAYKSKFDEAAFARMTVAGAEAWREVPDAAAWVREQRGGGDA
jgi:hypothetical protein